MHLESDAYIGPRPRYWLTHLSTVLAGMFELPVGSTTDKVELNHGSVAIRTYLDYAYGKDLYYGPTLSVADAFDFRDFVSTCDCDRLKPASSDIFLAATKASPMSYLRYASIRNDPDMARNALATSATKGVWPKAEEVIRTLEQLREGWYLPILRALMKAEGGHVIWLRWPTAEKIDLIRLPTGGKPTE